MGEFISRFRWILISADTLKLGLSKNKNVYYLKGQNLLVSGPCSGAMYSLTECLN